MEVFTEAQSATKKCPRCNADAHELVRIDAGMRVALSEGGHGKDVPAEACTNCITEFSAMVSQGAKLRAQRKAREANQMALWRSRINVLKQGRTYLAQKLFVEAAIEFEKYIRIVEIVNEAKPGGLTPEQLKKSGGPKSNEIDVFCSVIWDLIKIYDMNPSYKEKLKEKCETIIRFAKHTPIFGKIARRMVAYARKAKNKDVFNDLLKRCNAPRARCFIATAAYENPLHADVVLLTRFRDDILLQSFAGRAFVKVYYAISPYIAQVIERSEGLKSLTRKLLRPIIKWVSTQI